MAAAAQSPRLTREEVQLQSELGGMLWLPIAEDGTHQTICAEHHAIARAIAANEGTLARELTERHILDAIDRLAALHLTLVNT